MVRRTSERALQEFLEVLAEAPDDNFSNRARRILSSYAELRFRARGGSRCQLCRAAVRHVLPVEVTRAGGAVIRFSCLCQRCLHAERVLSESVQITLGDARWILKG